MKAVLRVPQGTKLVSLDLDFLAEASAEEWPRFLRKIGADFVAHSPKRKANWEATLAALPPVLERKKAIYLTGDVHPASPRADTVHWEVRGRLVPSDDPPKDLSRVSRQVGGIDGLNRNLAQLWPGEQSIQVTIGARFRVTSESYLPRLESPRVQEIDGPSGRQTMIEKLVSWGVAGPSSSAPRGGMSHSFPDEKHRWQLMLHGRVRVNASDGLIQAALDKLWKMWLPWLRKP